MKKVVKLNESDLVRLVKRVITEQFQSQFNVGDEISGMANPRGNRPIGISFKITKKGPQGLEGVLTEWGFSSNWGTKVGDKVIIKNIKKGNDNQSMCTLVIPGSKIGQVDVESCEKK